MTIDLGTDACEAGTVSGAVLDGLLEYYGEEAESEAIRGVAFGVAKGIYEGLRTQIADGEAIARSGSTLAGVEVEGGGGGAPADATYVVATSNGTLSAERVATTTATVTVDTSTPGQMKWAVASVAGVTGLLATAQTPAHHKTSHQNNGTDELDVTGLSGELADPQPPKTHASSHANGGGDEISVAGLSGELADPQPPKTHASSHSDGAADEIDLTDLAGFSGVSTQYLSGGGTWTEPKSLESSVAYAESIISNDVGISAGVAFEAFITTTIPEGFAGYISFEFGIAAGDAASPLAGYTHAGRALLRRATGGSLSVTDVGSTSLGEGTTYTASLNASGNAFRTQITMGTTTTAYVRGWYRIFGRVL